MNGKFYYSPLYSNTDIRKNVGPVLKMPNDIIQVISKHLSVSEFDFHVYDYKNYPNGILLLIHHTEPHDGLRGTVLFVNREREEDEVRTIVPSGMIITRSDCHFDDRGDYSGLPLEEDDVYSPSYEALTIRVFKFKGEVFFCTYKTLYAFNKVWNNSRFFGQMWDEFNLPHDPFPADTVDSKYVHTYSLVHRDLQYTSCYLKFEPGFVIYHGVSETGFQGHPDEKEFEYETIYPTHTIEKSFITKSFTFTEEEALSFLRYGLFSQEARENKEEENWELNPGEKILILKRGKCYECWSPGAQKRKELREKAVGGGIDDVVVSYHKFLSSILNLKTGLVVDLNNKKSFEIALLVKQQKERYSSFIQLIKLKKGEVFFEYSKEEPEFPISAPDLLKTATNYYILLLPPFLRDQYRNLLNNYYRSIEEIIQWLLTFSHNYNISYINSQIFEGIFRYDIEERFGKHTRIMSSLLKQAITYARDPRNVKGIDSVPDNLRYLLKRNLAIDILNLNYLRMRYEIINAKKYLDCFQPEYLYLLDSRGNIDREQVWDDLINRLQPLYERIKNKKEKKREKEKVEILFYDEKEEEKEREVKVTLTRKRV